MKIKGKYIDGKILIEKSKDVGRLYNKSRIGNPVSGDKLQIDFIEGCFLLDEGKIEIKNNDGFVDFKKLTIIASQEVKDFDIRYLAFKDLRKRGCMIRTCGDIKGIAFSDHKEEFFVCVFSEKNQFDFKETLGMIENIVNRNASLYFAIIDSEGDVTYYDVSEFDFKGAGKKEEYPVGKGFLFENGVVVYEEKTKDSLFEKEFFGKPFGDALRVSLVEALYLSKSGVLDIRDLDDSKISWKELFKKSEDLIPSLENVYNTYSDLKEKKLIVKTGFKFGTDFRVYTRSPDEIHAEYLVQTIKEKSRILWSEMSRVVRLAHSVNKEIIFACKSGGKIDYIKFGRLRP